MILDYSPKTKSTFQFTEKIDISKKVCGKHGWIAEIECTSQNFIKISKNKKFHFNFTIMKYMKIEFHFLFTIFKKSFEIGENGIS